MLKGNNNYKDTIVLGVILITFGITLISNNYIKTKREEAFNDMNLLLIDSIVTEEVNEEESIEEPVIENNNEEPIVEQEPSNEEVYYDTYVAVLSIPKIGLERGFYDKNSSSNNVNYNILFHKGSNYPDEKNGNVILASHSGTSSISYFKNLYKLEKGDIAYITFKETSYKYKVTKIYYEDKDGNVSIYRDKNKSVLTLITCTKNDNTKQTVYILERI